METMLTAEFAPVWAVVALALVVLGGAILFAVDPELAEVYVGDPPWMIAGLAVVVLVAMTVSASGPGLAHTVSAFLR